VSKRTIDEIKLEEYKKNNPSLNDIVNKIISSIVYIPFDKMLNEISFLISSLPKKKYCIPFLKDTKFGSENYIAYLLKNEFRIIENVSEI